MQVEKSSTRGRLEDALRLDSGLNSADGNLRTFPLRADANPLKQNSIRRSRRVSEANKIEPQQFFSMEEEITKLLAILEDESEDQEVDELLLKYLKAFESRSEVMKSIEDPCLPPIDDEEPGRFQETPNDWNDNVTDGLLYGEKEAGEAEEEGEGEEEEDNSQQGSRSGSRRSSRAGSKKEPLDAGDWNQEGEHYQWDVSPLKVVDIDDEEDEKEWLKRTFQPVQVASPLSKAQLLRRTVVWSALSTLKFQTYRSNVYPWWKDFWESACRDSSSLEEMLSNVSEFPLGDWDLEKFKEETMRQKERMKEFFRLKKVAAEELEAAEEGGKQERAETAAGVPMIADEVLPHLVSEEAFMKFFVDQKALKRKRPQKVQESFINAMLAAAKEIAAWTTSAVEVPKKALREIPQDVKDKLLAKSPRELLAEKFAEADPPAWMTNPHSWKSTHPVPGSGNYEPPGPAELSNGLVYLFKRRSRSEKEKPPNLRWPDVKVKFVEETGASTFKAYLSKSSESYDMSINKKLLSEVRKLFKWTGGASERILSKNADYWQLWQEKARADAVGGKGEAFTNAATVPDIPVEGAAEEADAEETEAPAEAAPQVEVVHGVRLRDLQELVERNRSWFEEKRMCKYTNKMRSKTMYDVCPELIIPATICMERIVTLQKEDMEKLKSYINGGVFVSDSDLTLRDDCKLGGLELPAGLTLHGKLVKGGPIRQRYWAQGPDRYLQWRTLPLHGREAKPLSEVAPIPKELQGRLDSPRSEPLGEASDRIWDASQLQAGETVVLRKGVSYIDVCARDGPGFPLDSFASHFWGDETLDFVNTLTKHATLVANKQKGEDPSDRVYYVCTFNNNQHRVELGSSWKTSPFNKALHYVAIMSKQDALRARDAVMVFDTDAKPLQRKWCVFEAWRCTELLLPLRLFCPDGEITRNSSTKTAKVVLQMVQEIDLESAQCSVKADAVMIDRAIEDARGGFAAVHAKLRTRVLDLMTFIGSLAVSVDQVTGKKVEEIELKVRGVHPEKVKGLMMATSDIAHDMCTLDSGEIGRNILLVAPAGSGKSVFSRALVRYAVGLSKASKAAEVLPVRVPIAELSKIIKRGKTDMRIQVKQAATLKDQQQITALQYELRKTKAEETLDEVLTHLFDIWAEVSFLRDSHAVTVEGEKTLLLILDGFDEAADERGEVIAWLRRYLQKRKKVVTLLTTRPSGLTGFGAYMSSGKANDQPYKGTVSHIDNEFDQLVLDATRSTAAPPGTYLQFPNMQEPCCVLANEQRFAITTKNSKPQLAVLTETKFAKPDKDKEAEPVPLSGGHVSMGVITDPDEVGCLKPGQYTGIELVQTPPRLGKGAKVMIEVLEEGKVREEIAARKERQRGEGGLDRHYTMGVKDLIRIEVEVAGQNYVLDSEGRVIIAAKIPLICSIEKATSAQKELAQYNDATFKDMTPGQDVKDCAEAFLVKPNLLGVLEVEQLKSLRLRVDTFLKRIEECKKRHNADIDPNQLDLVFEVKDLTTYTSLTRVLGKAEEKINLADTNIAVGDEYNEVAIRTQLQKELGFSDFEIDTIDADTAATIVRNIGGPNVSKLGGDDIQGFQMDLWDRPLMANLFGQFLGSKGLAFARNVGASIAELFVLRFVSSNLIHQAAVVAAPSAKEADVQKAKANIELGLRPTCRTKLNGARRVFERSELSNLRAAGEKQQGVKLWEDAVRGHLRLFEPQQGGRSVQFYHLRIQELLAAEDWGSMQFERAAAAMVEKDGLLQLGLAPLKFLVQMKLAEQVSPKKVLELDFKNRCSDRLITNLNLWLPKELSKFSLSLPPLFKSIDGQRKTAQLSASALGDALAVAKTLEKVELNLDGCKVVGDGMSDLTRMWQDNLTQLRKLTVRARYCHTLAPSSLTEFATGLPRCLKELHWDIEVSGSASISRNEPLGHVAEKLPEHLEKLCLNMSGWKLVDEDFITFGRQLPRSVKKLHLTARKTLVKAEGLVELCRGLPPGLSYLKIDFRMSLDVATGGLVDLGAAIPERLEELHLVCNRFIGDADLLGLVRGLPPNLKELDLDFRRDEKITEKGITDLGQHLPQHLRELSLRFPICMQIGGRGAEALCKFIPPNLVELCLQFDACRGFDDRALIALGAHFPKLLQRLELSMSSCKDMTDKGVLCIAENLPQSLKKLSFSMSGCDEVGSASIVTLGQNLPAGLSSLEFVCRRCDKMDNVAMKGLVANIQSTIQIILDFSETDAGDEGVIALAERVGKLPFTAGDNSCIRLRMRQCKGVTSQSIKQLAAQVNSVSYRELNLDFNGCFQVTHDVWAQFVTTRAGQGQGADSGAGGAATGDKHIASSQHLDFMERRFSVMFIPMVVDEEEEEEGDVPMP